MFLKACFQAIALCFILFPSIIYAQEQSADVQFGTKEEAIAMVKRVQKLFNEKGIEVTARAVMDKSNKDFHDKDLYAFIIDFDGLLKAQGAVPALVGRNLYNLKDQNKFPLVQEMIKVAKNNGSGWVDYKWPNPKTKVIEDKSSYILRLGDRHFVGVGVYRQ